MRAAPAFPHRFAGRCVGGAAVLAGGLLAACATSSPGERHPAAHPVAGSHRGVDSGSLWLDRVTFGIDSQSVEAYRRLGRAGFLDQQLDPDPHPLPPEIAAQIATLEVEHLDAAHELIAINEENKRINGLADPAAKEAARKPLNDRGTGAPPLDLKLV
jgi:hypothetical protein